VGTPVAFAFSRHQGSTSLSGKEDSIDPKHCAGPVIVGRRAGRRTLARTAPGVAETGTKLIADDAARKARQDWRDGNAELVRGNSPPRRAVGDGACSPQDVCGGMPWWQEEANPTGKSTRYQAMSLAET
jgi:hypothetical protein